MGRAASFATAQSDLGNYKDTKRHQGKTALVTFCGRPSSLIPAGRRADLALRQDLVRAGFAFPPPCLVTWQLLTT